MAEPINKELVKHLQSGAGTLMEIDCLRLLFLCRNCGVNVVYQTVSVKGETSRDSIESTLNKASSGIGLSSGALAELCVSEPGAVATGSSG